MDNVVDDPVDDGQTLVSLIPKARPHRHRAPRVLYVLLGLTLLGVIFEGHFIYRLHHKTHKTLETQPVVVWNGAAPFTGSNKIPPVLQKRTDDSKPVAFLKGSSLEKPEVGVMQFRLQTLLKGLQYKEGKLHIQQEGYYYIYSKIFFLKTCALFKHQVMWSSPRRRSPVRLMRSLGCNCLESDEDKNEDANSFLGGVFRLGEGDTVYVYVNDKTLIQGRAIDNIFGVFMI